jgi:hypothetical protein
LFASAKHGLVRPDFHIVNFFGFLTLAMALISLVASYRGVRAVYASSLLALALLIWVARVIRQDPLLVLADASGTRVLPLIWHTARGDIRPWLHTLSLSNCAQVAPLEPEIRSAIAGAEVASLAISYSCLAMDGLNLRLFPVPQRYSNYTPYLDDLNADWVRIQGPRLLLADWSAIDNRHPWAESPAMWLEIYRWYDTRLLGSRNLLLERRQTPRFTRLESVRDWKAPFSAGLDLDPSLHPAFWKATCRLSLQGKLAELFSRVPASTMSIVGSRPGEPFRIVPPVLTAPVMGTYLPSDLAGMAAAFAASPPAPSATRINFDGPGTAMYQAPCDFELLRPVRDPLHVGALSLAARHNCCR